MANKMFTEEDMKYLRASPYVLDVSPSIVHFSAFFKELFWNALQEGKAPREIIVELGIDPDILGQHRLTGLRGMIQKEVQAGRGFRDLKTFGSYLEACADPVVKVKYLEQQLAYKNQEIEFLKKIVSLGRED